MQPEPRSSPSGAGFPVGDRIVLPGLNRIDGPAGPVQVEPKVMEVLVHLAGRRGEVVSKEELVGAVWEGRFVSDDVVWRSIRELRRALGDGAIETIPKRGYRLVEAPPGEPGVQTPGYHEKTVPEGTAPSARLLQESTVRDSQGFEPLAGPGARPTLVPRRFLGLALVLGFALIAAIVLLGVRRLETASPAVERPRRVRLAVLPFANLSGDPSQDYLGDGLTEELISRLGSLPTDRLGVIGRTSVMSFKGKDAGLAEIARALDADYLLEGSVRRDGGQVRVAVRLIQASDQSTVWSDAQDLDAQGVLRLQSRVAESVARSLTPELLPGLSLPSNRSGKRSAASPAAHDAVLRGRYFLNRGMPADLRRSVEAFRQALALDPGSASAWAGLADALHLLVLFGAVPPREGVPPAEEAARKALALDDMLADTHATLGTIRFRYHWDWSGAEAEMRRALEINPSSAAAHHDLAWLLLAARRFDEAITEIRAAQELEPLSVRANADVGWVYYRARRHGEAIRQMERTLEMEPRFLPARHCLERALVHAGRPEEALRHALAGARQEGLDPAILRETGAADPTAARVALRRLTKHRLKHLIGRGSTVYVSPYALAALHAEIGDQDEALAALTRALEARDPMLVSLDVDPAFDPIRADRRFQEIVARVGPGSRRPS